MKKKIAILTFQSLDNYGQRLQNLAVQYIIQRIVPQAEIDSIAVNYGQSSFMGRFLRHLSLLLRKKHRAMRKMRRSFLAFNRQNMRIKHGKAEYDGFGYDIVVTGSDQVWNPWLSDNELRMYRLGYVKDARRIAVAPSLGYDDIPANKTEIYRECLDGLDFISVREESGKVALQPMTNQNVVRLIDPTLVLLAEEWKVFATNSEYCQALTGNKEYLLYFVINAVTDGVYEEARRFAKKQGLNFIDIGEQNRMGNPISPSEWLGLVANARLTITNSFHGICFSVVFHTDFIGYTRVFTQREGVDTRVLQLLDLLGIGDRFDNSVICYGKIDWKAVERVLADERIRFIEYMREALQ